MAKEELDIYDEAAKWALSMRDVQHSDMGSLIDERRLLFSESMKIFQSSTLTAEIDASRRVSGPQLFASQSLLETAQEELIKFKVPKAVAKTFYQNWIDNAQASLIILPFSYFKNPKSAPHILKQQFLSCFTMTYQHHHIIFFPKYVSIFQAWKIYPPHRNKEYQLFITKAKRLVFAKLYQNWCPRVPKPLPNPLASNNEELEPIGLENSHNTCFLNSILQAIMYTKPFYNALIFDSHVRCNQRGHFCALCAVERLVVEVHTTSSTMISPSYISDHLQDIMTNHLEGDHEDPIDFLDHFMESIRSCTVGAESCHLDDIFRFSMEKKVKCCICECINDIKIEEFRWLSLAMRNCRSIEEALMNFCDTIKLETDCQNCGGIGCNCIGYTTYQIFSPVLIIQLKRFDMVNGSIVKLENHISFPLLLDLENPLWIFRLHGMVVHHGHAITEGHYIAFVVMSSGKWYKVDDSEVDEIEGFNYVQQQQAYLLVYLREAKAM